MRPRIIVRRNPYEEPHNVHLDLSVTNGVFAAQTDLYCGTDELRVIGEGLSVFPRRVTDEFRWEYGSEDPEDRFYRYFLLRAFMFDKTRCALQFMINLNQEPPDEGIARFSIPSEPAAINRLGGLFLRFHELQHFEFEWNDRDDELFKSLRTQGASGTES